MTQWVALSRNEHAGANYRPRQGYAHAAGDDVAPVLVAELSRLLPHYVLAFIQGETGFLPVALLGTGLGQNLYLNHDQRWLADYVPAVLRGYPFALSASSHSEEQDKAVLSIKEDHLLPADGQAGEPLLTVEGELAPPVADSAQFLLHCQRDRHRTLTATHQLAEAGLLQPWPLKVISGPEAEPITLTGLYQLDMAKLDALPDDVYASLKGPAMALAQAQHFSKANTGQLSRRADYHRQRAPDRLTDELDSLFGEGDDEELKFDF